MSWSIEFRAHIAKKILCQGNAGDGGGFGPQDTRSHAGGHESGVHGLLTLLLLQPVIIDLATAPVDLIVVAVFGLVCALPFWLYLRGVAGRA